VRAWAGASKKGRARPGRAKLPILASIIPDFHEGLGWQRGQLRGSFVPTEEFMASAMDDEEAQK